ncbi:MAG: hypothetical protein ACLQU5_16105 [Isosphaeraceae bacterium]
MDGPNVLELTNDVRILPALLIASVMAYGLTVLVMKRSILTEKLARRGYHISREYSTDPLEPIQVGEVMTTDVEVRKREKAGQVRYWQYGQAEKSPDLAISDQPFEGGYSSTRCK